MKSVSCFYLFLIWVISVGKGGRKKPKLAKKKKAKKKKKKMEKENDLVGSSQGSDSQLSEAENK